MSDILWGLLIYLPVPEFVRVSAPSFNCLTDKYEMFLIWTSEVTQLCREPFVKRLVI